MNVRNLEQVMMQKRVLYNAKKSAIMIYRSKILKGCTILDFKLNGIILNVFSIDISNDADINRQRRTLFV